MNLAVPKDFFFVLLRVRAVGRAGDNLSSRFYSALPPSSSKEFWLLLSLLPFFFSWPNQLFFPSHQSYPCYSAGISTQLHSKMFRGRKSWEEASQKVLGRRIVNMGLPCVSEASSLIQEKKISWKFTHKITEEKGNIPSK